MCISARFILPAILFIALSAIGAPAAIVPSGIDRWVAVHGNDLGDCSDKLSPCLSIQYAIKQSGSGDVVNVNDGTYHGEINFEGKAITVRSVNGAKNTVINGVMYGNWDLSAVTFNSGELSTSTLDGFTVTEGWSQYGGGIKVVDSSPTIKNCVITNSWSGSGGGVYCLNSAPIITGCTISNNGTGFTGGGIHSEDSSPIITDSTISGNEAKYGGGMYSINSSPEVSGTTISGNYARSNEEGHGGGAYTENSSATFTNCTFSDNHAGGFTRRNGGGMHNVNSSVEVQGCTIFENSAGSSGGGIYNDTSSLLINGSTINANSAGKGGGIGNLDSSPEITNSIISGNSTVSYGGGIYNKDSSSMILTDSTIENNSADRSGGGIYNDQTDLSTSRLSMKITGCDIVANSAVEEGGGIYNALSSPEITSCTISDNSANDGAGIYNGSSSPEIVSCTISGNRAANDGGGIYNYFSWSLTPPLMKLSGCSVIGNSAGMDGGGIYDHHSSPEITNCTISGNLAAMYGGGIYNDTSHPSLTNCTIAGNSAVSGGGIYHFESTGRASVVNSILWGNAPGEVQLDSSDMTIEYSNIEGYWPGTGNINEDPLFINPLPVTENPTTAGNYHLQQDSPSKDTGTDDASTYPALPSIDIDGDARPQGLGWDMGSDEYAADSLWSTAADLGDGWCWIEWFGYFNLNFDRWIFHVEHGFLYPFGSSTDSIVFWDSAMDAFWWTSENQYPYIYRFSDGEWLWYLEGSSSPRWFVRLSDGVWEER